MSCFFDPAELSGLFVLPVYPWGRTIDIMYVYTGQECANNFVEIPLNEFSESLYRQIKAVKNLVNIYGEAFLGMTMTLSRMSVPLPHTHISVLGNRRDLLAIHNFRKNTNWDNGLSKELSEQIKYAIESPLKQIHNCSITTDNI